MTTLEQRRHQADLAMVYKIVRRGNMRLSLICGPWFRPATGGEPATRTATDPSNVRIKPSGRCAATSSQ